MSEITPLTKDQLFEKKIAENTGSDYNVGDISDVVPVTKDQSFLKEIALNSAGQSEDITELEEKVTANAEAIEAIVNEYGAKNLLPNNAKSQTVADGTITVNSDGSIRTNIATTNGVAYDITDYFTVPIGDYIFSKGMSQRQSQIWLQFFNGSTFVKDIKLEGEASKLVTIDYDGYTQIKCVGYIPSSTTIDTTIYPMIRDARIKDSTYVPYAMTNRELTERVDRGSVSVTTDGVKTYKQLLCELFSLATYSRILVNMRTAVLDIDGGMIPLVYSELNGTGFQFGTSIVYNGMPNIAYVRLHETDSSYETYYDGVNHVLTDSIPSNRTYTLYF